MVIGEEVRGVHEQTIQGETLLTQGQEDLFLQTMDGGGGENRFARGRSAPGGGEAVQVAEEGLGRGVIPGVPKEGKGGRGEPVRHLLPAEGLLRSPQHLQEEILGDRHSALMSAGDPLVQRIEEPRLLSGAQESRGLAKGVGLQAGLSLAGKAGAEGLGRPQVHLPGATNALGGTVGLDDPEVALPPREAPLEMQNSTVATKYIASPVWMGNMSDKRPNIARRGIGSTDYSGNTNLGVKLEDLSRSGRNPILLRQDEPKVTRHG